LPISAAADKVAGMAFLPLLWLAATTSEANAALIAELSAACRVPATVARELTDEDVVEFASRLAAPKGPFPGPCRRDPALALRLARAVAESPSASSAKAYRVLDGIYSYGLGVRPDREQARSYRRRAWLLGMEGLPGAFATPAERQAYFAAPENIAWLRARIAAGASLEERVRLAMALISRRGPGDVEEARRSLRDPALAGFTDARRLLAMTVLEEPAAPAQVAAAAATLRPLAASPGSGPETRPVLLRLGRLQLAQARTPEQNWEAVQSLAAAAYAGESEAAGAFREALLAANGGREPEPMNLTAPPPRLVDDDYPAAAIRGGITGVVSLRALVDPRGRIVFTEGAGEPKVLVDAVRSTYVRRPGPDLPIGVPRPSPYVWVPLPKVTFRLPAD
jgi:hypothetical protein